MSWENLLVNTGNLESGRFYYVLTDSNATTLMIPKSEIDSAIASLEANNVKVLAIEEDFNNLKRIILDNQARINNLEDSEIDFHSRFLSVLEAFSIRHEFHNKQEIVVESNREILSYVVCEERIKDGIMVHDDITSSVAIQIIREDNKSKLIIKSNVPISGYVKVL